MERLTDVHADTGNIAGFAEALPRCGLPPGSDRCARSPCAEREAAG